MYEFTRRELVQSMEGLTDSVFCGLVRMYTEFVSVLSSGLAFPLAQYLLLLPPTALQFLVGTVIDLGTPPTLVAVFFWRHLIKPLWAFFPALPGLNVIANQRRTSPGMAAIAPDFAFFFEPSLRPPRARANRVFAGRVDAPGNLLVLEEAP